MKTLKPTNYEEYSNQLKRKDIGGSLDKQFIRVDSKFISNYFDEISKSDSSYVSYVDDLIRECYDPNYRDENGKKKLPLQYFSVLVKETSNRYSGPGSSNEAVGARLANLFGVPTVYNQQVMHDGEKSILSLDFLKPGEVVTSIVDVHEEKYPEINTMEIVNRYDGYQNIGAWCNIIYEMIDYKLEKDIPNREQMMNDVVGDFCIQLFFRNLILNDEDFKAHNVCLIFSEDYTSVKLAPGLDYESCNFKSYGLHSFLEYLFSYFDFMNKYFPEKLASFMARFEKVCYRKNGEFNPTRMNKILRDNHSADYIAEDYMKCLEQNIGRIHFGYQVFKSNPDKNFSDEDINQLYKEYEDRDDILYKD